MVSTFFANLREGFEKNTSTGVRLMVHQVLRSHAGGVVCEESDGFFASKAIKKLSINKLI